MGARRLRFLLVVAIAMIGWMPSAFAGQDQERRALFARVFNSCVGERDGLEFCRYAAEQGNSMAQFFLGERYEKGWGLRQSYLHAAKWYRRAAKQGHAQSQLAIGKMYAVGRGARQDLVKAYTWINLARAGGERDAPQQLDAVSRRMTTDQIAEGERQTLLWQAKNKR